MNYDRRTASARSLEEKVYGSIIGYDFPFRYMKISDKVPSMAIHLMPHTNHPFRKPSH